MKSLRAQVSQLKEQLKVAQGEVSTLKEDKAKSSSSSFATSSSSAGHSSLSTSSSTLPLLPLDEGESEEAIAALLKLREEVIAAMTELRVQGLAAARAMQAARAYRSEVEALKNQMKLRIDDSNYNSNTESKNSPRNVSKSTATPQKATSGNPYA